MNPHLPTLPTDPDADAHTGTQFSCMNPAAHFQKIIIAMHIQEERLNHIVNLHYITHSTNTISVVERGTRMDLLDLDVAVAGTELGWNPFWELV